MGSKQTMARIGGLIKTKRREEKLGLREAAKASGISASTLSRLERGVSTSLPDIETLNNLSRWLEVPLSSLLQAERTTQKVSTLEIQTPDQVEVYLRADKNLAPQTAEALSKMFRALYDQFTSGQGDKRLSR